MALTDAQKEAQLRAVGWTPSPGDSVAAAWARTATPADQAAANAPDSSMPAQTAGAYTPAAFQQAVTSAVTPFAQQTSGVTAAQLAEQKRQFDANLEWTKQMWANQGLPQLQIQQQAQALAQKEFESQAAIAAANVTGYYNAPAGTGTASPSTAASTNALLAQNPALGDPNYQKVLQAARGWVFWPGENLGPDGKPTTGAYPNAADQSAPAQTAPLGTPTLANIAQQAQLSGMYNGAPTEAARQFNTTTGLDYLKTAASLGGPADYFQQSNFLRGAAGNAQVPAFLQALQNNTGLSAYTAPTGAAPAVQSMGTLAGGLLGAAPATNQQAALSAIGALGARGGGALAPQAIEQLNPDELNLLSSGLKASGFSMPSFLANYQQNRIGQASAQAA